MGLSLFREHIMLYGGVHDVEVYKEVPERVPASDGEASASGPDTNGVSS